MPPKDTDPNIKPLDLDQIHADLDYASSGIDGANLPYHPYALHAMRAAEKLIAEVERLGDERDALADGNADMAQRLQEVKDLAGWFDRNAGDKGQFCDDVWDVVTR